MSILSAIDSPALGGSDATGEVSAGATGTDIRRRMPRLVVVTPTGRAPSGRPVRAGGAGKPRSSSIASSRLGAAPPVVVRGTVLTRRQASGSRAPVRLTRRGRAVVVCLLVTGLTIGALLISLLASGGAQATNHGQARAGYQGMRQIVVRPGQTLWSIASAAEPSADTRVVVQEIMSANALAGGLISAGQLLWIPR
jgi:LysM domain